MTECLKERPVRVQCQGSVTYVFLHSDCQVPSDLHVASPESPAGDVEKMQKDRVDLEEARLKGKNAPLSAELRSPFRVKCSVPKASWRTGVRRWDVEGGK